MTKWEIIQQPGGPDETYDVFSWHPNGKDRYLVADDLPIEDARLIAAAPDMKEALEKLLEYEPSDRSEFRSDSKGDRQFDQAKSDFAAARAALAKAEEK